MKLKRFTRGEKAIVFATVVNSADDGGDVQAEEEHTAAIKVAPLPSLDDSLQDLVPVIGEVMEYTKGYLKGIGIVGFSVGHTKNGTRSMGIVYIKKLDKLDTSHRMKTPMFRIDSPADGEHGTLETKHSDLCYNAIEEALRYIQDPVNGRSQQLLDLGGGTPDGGENEDVDGDLQGLKIVS